MKDLDELKKLEKYADDEAVLNEFMAVKEAQKNRLAAFVKEHDGVDIDPNTILTFRSSVCTNTRGSSLTLCLYCISTMVSRTAL